MTERFFYWAGVAIVALLTVGVGAIALEWAANRAVRAFGVYRELVAFMWARAAVKRRNGSGPLPCDFHRAHDFKSRPGCPECDMLRGVTLER